jgi:hypothetical protein
MVSASYLRSARFDPDEIRRITARAKQSGLLRGPGDVAPVEKNGKPVAADAGLRSQWMDVTPDLARRWLENNFRNRPISEDVVAAYARDMTNGVWVPTHQGVAFNDADALIDGQHRLHAIVRSGKTVRMMVTFGLPVKIEGSEMTTMDAVDRGRTRSVADQLKIEHGMKDGSAVAMICASLGAICYGHRTRRLSVGQTLEIYRAYEQPLQFVIAARVKDHGLKAAGFLAACVFALATEDGVAGQITACHRELMKGELRQPASALELLRTFLVSDDAKLLNRSTDRGLAELTLQAIYLRITGKAFKKLEPSQDGVTFFRGLQPERVEKIAAMFRLPDAVR